MSCKLPLEESLEFSKQEALEKVNITSFQEIGDLMTFRLKTSLFVIKFMRSGWK